MIKAPDGVMLSRCSERKLNWYLRQGIADLIAPGVIQLKFEPSGRKNVGDPFMYEAKPNHCVVCGKKENLTRHHTIPHCVIRYMSDAFKEYNSHDILPMCWWCHDRYERYSDAKRQVYADALGITLAGKNHDRLIYLENAQARAISLMRYGHVIPLARQEELKKEVLAAFGHLDLMKIDDLTHEDVQDLAGYEYFGEVLVDTVTDENEFAREWREHFIETMKPQYMPKHWRADIVKEM
jgi:hypothetical protein